MAWGKGWEETTTPPVKTFEVKPEWAIDAANYPIVKGWDLGQGDDYTIVVLPFEHRNKSISRSCIIVGQLAIHEALDVWGWTVSHVPTLTKFGRGFPNPEYTGYTKEQLIKWCRAVQSEQQELWAAVNSLTPENYEDKKYTREKLRDYCRSIEIE